MSRPAYVLLLLGVSALAGVHAKIPDYIQVCKRSDPNIDQCIMNSIEKIRPKLIKGIPELDVPEIEPLVIPEIVISRGNQGFRAVGNDVKVYGVSNFEIKSLKSDVNKLEYIVSIRLPKLRFEALYDVNAKILNLNIKGKGPLQCNTTDVEGTGILKGHKETRKDGKIYVKFDSLDLKLKMKNYSIKLDGLFNGDKQLNDAINVALNDNKRELMNLLRPRAENTVSEVLLEIANKITEHFEYDELFPK